MAADRAGSGQGVSADTSEGGDPSSSPGRVHGGRCGFASIARPRSAAVNLLWRAVHLMIEAMSLLSEQAGEAQSKL